MKLLHLSQEVTVEEGARGCRGVRGRGGRGRGAVRPKTVCYIMGSYSMTHT